MVSRTRSMSSYSASKLDGESLPRRYSDTPYHFSKSNLNIASLLEMTLDGT